MQQGFNSRPLARQIVDQNNEDKPLSSEEMLRRARSGLGDSEPTPPAADDMESSYERLEQELDFGSEPQVVDEAEIEPEPYEPPTPEPVAPQPSDTGVGGWAPPRTDDDAGVGGWAPPPRTEPQQGPWGGQLPVPDQKRQGGGNAAKILGLMVIIAVVGLAVYGMVDTTKKVEDMEVGDCLNVPEGEEFSSFDVIDCNDPHQLEAYAIIDMSTVSTRYLIGTSYPGDDVYYDGLVECAGEPFESYVGVPYSSIPEGDTVLDINAITPTLESWQEFHDRQVQCVLLTFDMTTGEILETSGSYRGSGG